uniref:Uncharacterized protein n=1 Tax=Avena sativa TaxID=4498 RepID=A0ACD5UL99_AVESA
MSRKSWKPRAGPGCVALAPEFQWKALNPNPIPAEVPGCSRAAEVPDDVFVDIAVEVEHLRLNVPAAAEVEKEIVSQLVGIGMELSQEELRANDQMQEDEILALEAIFADSVVILNKKEGQRSFQVHVHIEIPDGIDVSSRLDYGVDFIILPCHHYFCQKCMRTYCKMHVKEGTVLKLTCPDTKCGGVVSPNILKTLLEEDEFERWEGLLLQRTLDAMNDLVYCPRCETACLEDECNDAVCPSCLFSFCTLCTNHRHVGKDCMTPEERIRILEERLKSKKLQSDQKKIDEARSLQTIMRDAKQCPRCKMAISKIEGCNKMTCSNCGHYFCYVCNSAIAGYDHFGSGACRLFSWDDLDRWEARMNPGRRRVQHQPVAQEDAPAPAPAPLPEMQYTYPCPTCGKQYAKFGNNNHIRCGSCRTHYCALCRKTVDKTSRHFGPRGCKQHTADQ